MPTQQCVHCRSNPGAVLNCESQSLHPSDLLRQHAGEKIVGSPGATGTTILTVDIVCAHAQ
jgi:hypothetical protein